MSIGTDLWINGTLCSNVETVALPMANEEGTGPDPDGYIQTYQDIHETTVMPSHVLSGYYFFNHEGDYLSGTIGNATFSSANSITVTNSGTVTVKFNTSSAGYASGSFSVTNTAFFAVQAAKSYYASTTDYLAIAGDVYTKGDQTIKSVITTNLSASNIVSGVTIKVGDELNASRIAQVTGTAVLGTDTTDATLTSGDQMLATYTAYANGTKYTGTIATKSASDVTAAGSQTTTPSGYYSQAVTKSISGGTATTPATTITVTPGITINTNGVITATASGTSSVAPTVNAGYIATGTSGTITVSGSKTSQLTSQTASTYYTSTADRTIASQRWLVGSQTIKSVTTTNLSASNVIAGVTIQVGDSGNASRIAYVAGGVTIHKYYTGSGTPSAGLGSNGDLYLQI